MSPSLRRYRDWAILAGVGTVALVGLIWIGLVLFPLMSWDVYETGRLFIVGILSGLLAVAFGDRRAYAKGKADGYQHGHDNGYQAGWDARGKSRSFVGLPTFTNTGNNPAGEDLTAIPRIYDTNKGENPLDFPHSGSHIYTTE